MQSRSNHVNERVEILPVFPSANLSVPIVIAAAGEQASERFFEFFAGQIRNRNTRGAYVQAAQQFFCMV